MCEFPNNQSLKVDTNFKSTTTFLYVLMFLKPTHINQFPKEKIAPVRTSLFGQEKLKLKWCACKVLVVIVLVNIFN